MRCPACLVLILAAVGCRAQPAGTLTVETLPLPLGETTVRLVVHRAATPGMASLLVVHDDENTAVEAGLDVVQARGGRLVELRAQGVRNVEFADRGRTYRFDPNRVFTDAGASATLATQSGGAVSAAVEAGVRRFAEAVTAAYGADSARVVVALHNNTEGAYSAASYGPGGALATDAAAVHLPEGADPDDFFFVTTRRLYDAFASEGFPVVLQDNARVTDDGSLSVWAGRRGIPYVNVEAQHGHRERQRAMLEALLRVLSRCAEGDG